MNIPLLTVWWKHEPECCRRWAFWDLQKTWQLRRPAPPPGWLSPQQHQTVTDRRKVISQLSEKPETFRIFFFAVLQVRIHFVLSDLMLLCVQSLKL